MYVKIGEEIAFHPGECLEEFVESCRMTPYQLASQIGMDVDYVQGLINGSQSVTKNLRKQWQTIMGLLMMDSSG